ncbi:MAG: Gmad2 immunoglobulin-like domain-containing protein [Anaerolineales bacterium]
MKVPRWFVMVLLLLLPLACGLPTPSTPQPTSPPAPTTALPTSAVPTLTTSAPPPGPTNTQPPPPTPAGTLPTPTATTPSRPEEAILILEPGPGSRVISPVRVAGLADPTFEQNLVVRILLDDGTQIALTPTTIGADLGQRGPFAVDVPFTITGERNAFIQVYDQSARDGGIIHLETVGVTLADSGPANIVPGTVHPEQIHIQLPLPGDTVSGGVAHVEGFGLASFEGTLVIEVYDETGTMVGQEPIIVQAPDLGFPGPFSADVAYNVASIGPGRIVVRDPSVAFVGDYHISSVEITLAP